MENKDSKLMTLTGLWLKETKDGRAYMSGNFSPRINLLIFKNNKKKKDTDPDYYACLAPYEPKQQREPGQDDEGDVGF